MKRRILSLLLVLVLLVTVSVLAVEANDYTTYEEAIAEYYNAETGKYDEPATLKFYCEHCKDEMTWDLWDGSTAVATADTAMTHEHKYTPDEGITLGGNRVVQNSVCLYLGGDINNDSTNSTTNNSYMFRTYGKQAWADGAEFNITFSVMGNGTLRLNGNETLGNGNIINMTSIATSTSGATISVKGEVNIYSGVTLDANGITKTKGDRGCALSVQQSYNKMNLYGCTVIGGTASDGGSIAVTNGQLNIYEGTVIRDGKSVYSTTKSGSTTTYYCYGGNLYLETGTVNMYGGTIQDGCCSTTTRSGGCNVAIKSGKFNLYGGTLSNDTATTEAWMGGNILIIGGALNIEEKNGAEILITGGKAARGGCIGVSGSPKITMKSGTIENGVGEVSGGCIFTETNGTGYFKVQGGIIQNGRTTKSAGNWGGTVGVAGTFELSGDAQIIGGTAQNGATMATVGGGMSSGKIGEITLAGGSVIGGTATVGGGAICLTGGTMVVDGASITAGTAPKGGAILVTGATWNKKDLTGTLTLTNGTVTGVDAENLSGGAIFLDKGAVIQNGGTIEGCNTGTGSGGAVYVAGGTYTMNNGTIQNGKAKSGGNVFIENATFTMAGGNILTGEANNHGGNVYLTIGAEMTMEDGLIAAGLIRATSGSHFGGNVAVFNSAKFTMNGGKLTTKYEDTTGGAKYGDNIGYWGDTTGGRIEVTGGIIEGGTGYGGAMRISSEKENGITVKIGAVEFNNEAASSDIYTNHEAEMQDIIIAEGFNDKMLMSIEDGTTASLVQGAAINPDFITCEGFTGDKVVVYDRENQYPVYGDGEKLVIAQAAVLDGKNVLVGGTYADVTAAYAENKGEANAQNYIKLFNMDGQTITAAEGALIDVNGNNVTVDSAAAVAVIDSATNDYDDTDAAKITFANAVGTGADVNLTINGQQGTRRYALIKNDDGTYGAHRFYITQRNVGIRVNEDDAAPDLIFSGSFRGTQTFAANVEAFGIDFQHEGASLYKVNYLDHEQAFTSGNMIYGKNVNIVVSEQAAKDGYGEKLIKGVPYITLKGGIELTAQVIEEATSVKAQVESFKANYATLSDSQKAIYDAMVEKSGALFTTLGWDYAVA